MDCTTLIDLLPEYIRRRLPAASQAAARAHLAACAACAAAYEEELALAQMLHGTDAAAPPSLLPQIMASVRAEPQIAPTFRLRPLDVAIALACAVALAGMLLAIAALQAILPDVGGALDPRALLDNSTWSILLLTALSGGLGMALSLGVGAAAWNATRRA